MIQLTKNKQRLASIMWKHADHARDMFMARRTIWLLSYYYLQGFRRFSIFDPESTGEVRAHLISEDGQLPYQSQELLNAINRVSGRLEGMDCTPSATRQGYGLSSFRDAALAQVILDSIIDESQLDKIKNEASYFLTTLGCVGIAGKVQEHETIGLVGDLEVVHPREIFPFPATCTDHTKAEGILRERMVPMSMLKEVYGPKVESNKDKMEWFLVDPGDDWHSYVDDENGRHGLHGGASLNRRQGMGFGTTGNVNSSETEEIAVVRIRELWLQGPGDTCSRYVISSGDYVLDDQDLSDREVYCPISVARFFDNGSWYGCGMFDLMFGIHRHAERLVQDLFRNMQEIDRYGVVVMPSGEMNQDLQLRDIGDKTMKALMWQPDPYAADVGFKPFHIQQFNSGDMPGKVANYARDIMESINPIRDLIEEKGRIDSASGLQYLEEQMSRHLSKPSLQMAGAMGKVYRSMAQQASSQLVGTGRSLPIKHVNLDMAGAVIDFEEGTVSFRVNPIPRLRAIKFDINNRSPKSEVARKQEAKEMWQLGMFGDDNLAFKLQMLRDDIDIPAGLDNIRGSYEVAVRLMLQLFNDGETPGEVVFVPHLTKPDVLMMVYEQFATGPVLQHASPEVQNVFLDLQNTLLDSMGMVLPAAVPNPDEAAMMEAQAAQAGQGALPGGPLPTR